jgi:hypothetical protein
MADRTRIYKSTDWSIWTYVPEPGSFILDFSDLDGTDVLGTTGGGLEQLDAQIGNISLVEGGQVTNGTFLDLTPNQLSAEIIIRDFTAADANKYLVGTSIALTLKNEASIDNPIFGFNTPYFLGRIRSFSVNVLPGEDFATVSINATSKLEDDLNVLMGVEKSTVFSKNGVLFPYLENLGINSRATTTYRFANNEFEEKTVGEWLGEMITTSGDIPIDGLEPDIDGLWIEMLQSRIPYSYYAAERFFDETEISQAILDWDGAGSPTGVSLTLYSDSEIQYFYGATSQNSNGVFNYSYTADVQDLTELIEVGQSILNRSPKIFGPVEITHETAREYQEITFVSNPVDYYYYWPNNCGKVGETLSIDLPSQGFTNFKTKITGRTIEITPDNWITTYNLWKGL